MTTERLTFPFSKAGRLGRLPNLKMVQIYGGVVGAIALNFSTSFSTVGGAIAQDTQPAVTQPLVTQPLVTPAEVEPAGAMAEPLPRSITPPADPAPAPTPFVPLRSGIIDVSKGANAIESVGHLRPRDIQSSDNDGLDWVQTVNLPLYVTPGGEHWGWIYKGWLIPKGQPYLAMGRDAGFAMVRSYENLYTFPVLETRSDGWFRVQYTPGGSAWAHTSQLALGDELLTVETWENRLQAQGSVYFLNSRKAQALRSQPQQSTNMISLIAADSLIEPLEFQGDWMRVRATSPIANCEPLSGAAVSEGWMRWRGDRREALVWYRPEGGCSQ